MRKVVLLFILFVSMLSTVLSAAEAPRSIVGITLGSNIKDYEDRIAMNTSVPIWNSEYISKVALRKVKGFESGYIVYGNCKVPGRIIRIKLNYENDTRAFFDTLLSTLTKRYGDPNEWRGNPFGTLKVWKWSFKDEGKNSISMILQRYEGEDDAFTPGNSIKIAITNFTEEEQACHKEKKRDEKPDQPTESVTGKPNFEWYLPQ